MTARKDRAQPGDVIRLYKLRARLHHLQPDGVASTAHPAWFIVKAVYDEALIADVLKLTHPHDGLGSRMRTRKQWKLANNHRCRNEWGDGHYHVVRPEHWPDDIAALVMAYKLAGENYG